MPEVITILALTLEFVGTILIGLSVLRVHLKLEEEHKVDKKVERSIERERVMTILGLLLIALGFILSFF